MYVCVDHRKMMRGAETISLLLLAIAMLVACAENDEVVMLTEPAMVKTELTFAFANVKAATHQTRVIINYFADYAFNFGFSLRADVLCNVNF